MIFGYPNDTPQSQVRPFDSAQFVDPQARVALIERLTNDGSVADHLLRLRRHDGEPIWVEVTARADVLSGRNTPRHSLRIEALLRDVTERKKVDDNTRDIYQQLVQAEKMAALGQTMSGVAHELNNPLATILSWAERLAQRDTRDEHLRKGLEIIFSESERAARIVRNLLMFARKRQTTRAMVDVNQVMRETLALRAYEQHLTNISVIDALAAGLPQTFADGHQIKQVLLNLVINAEQAMLSANGRGVLVVRTWHDAEKETVILEINDDGPGVPDALQAKIFDPFFTTKEIGKGTGLGLTVAYAIMQEHGGRLRLDSSPGSGASFFVELPVMGAKHQLTFEKPAASRLSAPAAAGNHTQHHPLRTVEPAAAAVAAPILVVEDETKLASAVVEALGDAGYIVQHATDGQAALAKVKSEPFGLVICDLKMPRLDGKAFYRALTGALPDLAKRVIFMTGDLAGTDAEVFLNQTGCRWLAKPFRLTDLLKVVRETFPKGGVQSPTTSVTPPTRSTWRGPGTGARGPRAS